MALKSPRKEAIRHCPLVPLVLAMPCPKCVFAEEGGPLFLSKEKVITFNITLAHLSVGESREESGFAF